MMEATTTTTTMNVGGAIVRIHRPILTPEERERREKIVRAELAKFGRAAMERGVDLEDWSKMKQAKGRASA